MLTINICVGSACHLKGSYKVINSIQNFIEKNNVKDKVEIKGSFCLGHCTEGVSVKVKDQIYSVNEENAEEFFNNVILRNI
ncbi:(2Fe-2S) ferredoxin domain-containing protein [Clostridium sp. FAM 1755]|uniref:(2Fe-2S) ferredoxin domain-containing protein n=1 Tax=Clostridium TaxID=1485 RepID=UPI0013D86712|nr:(2Fe-2S) ferredoxin domain-containing protein [Clostridium sporogenes]EJP6473446.1 (2Fe-2S) ferredoxin domain-containing protein [Clostridium botulinum]NFV11948.1 (2Fe-2S) ferredoxin domain-containing protein [Clostridium sporogenes]